MSITKGTPASSQIIWLEQEVERLTKERDEAREMLAVVRVVLDGATERLEQVEDERDAALAAILTAEMMLSELSVNASEKCQMAYDHLHRYRVGGDE